jgi:hypothetical protein
MPVLTLIGYFISMEILQDHTLFSGSFKGYIKANLFSLFFILPGITLALVLFPYNLTLLILRRKMSLLNKTLILESIFVIVFCLWASFADIWAYPYWKNIIYILYLFVPSFICASALHLTADRSFKN